VILGQGLHDLQRVRFVVVLEDHVEAGGEEGKTLNDFFKKLVVFVSVVGAVD